MIQGLTKFSLGVLLAGCLSGSAWAQQPGGAISGTLDGEPVSWVINSQQSDFSGGDKYWEVSITGWKGKRPPGVGLVNISFRFDNAETSMGSVRVITPQGTPDLVGNDKTDVSVKVTSASEDNGFLSLKGSVSAVLGRSENLGHTVDLSEKHAIELEFDGVVEVLGH